MEKKMQKVEKPIMVLREEFITNLSELVVNSNLPLFVIEPIMRDVLTEVSAGVKRRYEMERAQYEQALMNAASIEGEQDDREKISEEIKKDSTEK